MIPSFSCQLWYISICQIISLLYLFVLLSMAVTPPQDHMTLEDDDYNIDETQSTPSSIDIGTTPSPFWLPNPTSNDHTQSPFVYMNTFNPMTSTNNGARNININPIQPYSASSSPTMDYQPSVFDNSLDIGSRIQNEYQYRPPPEQPPPPLHPMIYLPNGIDRKYPSLRSLFSSFSLENTGYGTRGPMILNSIIGDRRANFPDYPQTITSGAFDQFRPANIFRPNGFLNQIPGFGGYGSGIIGRIGGWLGDKKIIPLPTNDYHRIIGQPIALLNGRHSDMFIDDYQNGGGRSLQIPPPLYPNPYVGGMNFVGNNNRNGFVDYINNNNNYGINGYHP